MIQIELSDEEERLSNRDARELDEAATLLEIAKRSAINSRQNPTPRRSSQENTLESLVPSNAMRSISPGNAPLLKYSHFKKPRASSQIGEGVVSDHSVDISEEEDRKEREQIERDAEENIRIIRKVA